MFGVKTQKYDNKGEQMLGKYDHIVDQKTLIGCLIKALELLIDSDKAIRRIKIDLFDEEEPYIDLKQVRVSDDIYSILSGEGMYKGEDDTG